jgi:hypothetical protein
MKGGNARKESALLERSINGGGGYCFCPDTRDILFTAKRMMRLRFKEYGSLYCKR